MADHSLVFLIASPGEMREGLECLLLATAEVGQVIKADNIQSARQMAGGKCPDLFLLEFAIAGNQFRPDPATQSDQCPHSTYLVLADDVHQQKQAQAAGADLVVLKGFPAAELSATVSRMLATAASIEIKDEPVHTRAGRHPAPTSPAEDRPRGSFERTKDRKQEVAHVTDSP